MNLIIGPFKKGLEILLDDIEKTHFSQKKYIYKSYILATSSSINKVKTREFPQIFNKNLLAIVNHCRTPETFCYLEK